MTLLELIAKAKTTKLTEDNALIIFFVGFICSVGFMAILTFLLTTFLG